MIHYFLQLLYLWSELLYRVMTFSQLCTEHSSTRNQFFHSMKTPDTRMSKCFFSQRQFFVLSGLLSSRFFIAFLDWYNRFPNDWNQVVFEDYEKNCGETLLCILAFAPQILFLQAYNLHVFQGINSLNVWIRESEEMFVVSFYLKMLWRNFFFVGRCFLTRHPFASKERNGFHRTLRDLRWPWHQVFSYRVIHLWSVSTCFSLLQTQCPNPIRKGVSAKIVSRSETRSVEEQRLDTW